MERKEGILKTKSKYMSLLLRHQPEKAGITLDKEGWTDVDTLCVVIGASFEEMEFIVETNDKQRFAFNGDKTKIRASQGHTLKEVDLKLIATKPPDVLFHGTKKEFLPSILEKGLFKMQRNHLHLSEELETATRVANRRKGENVILNIDSKLMHKDGFKFFISSNGVWLTDEVPSGYINL